MRARAHARTHTHTHITSVTSVVRLFRGGTQALLLVTLGPSEAKRNFSAQMFQTVPEVPNDQPHQPPKHSDAEDHTEQTEAANGEDHC